MKKLFAMIVTLMLCLSLPLPLLAEGVVPGVNAFFDWSYLATYSGAIAAVVFLVQLIKLPLDKLARIRTRALVYAVSTLIVLGAQYFTLHSLDLEAIVLALLNGAIVAFSAMGVYERAIAIPESQAAIDNLVGGPVYVGRISEAVELKSDMDEGENAGKVEEDVSHQTQESEGEKNEGTQTGV